MNFIYILNGLVIEMYCNCILMFNDFVIQNYFRITSGKQKKRSTSSRQSQNDESQSNESQSQEPQSQKSQCLESQSQKSQSQKSLRLESSSSKVSNEPKRDFKRKYFKKNLGFRWGRLALLEFSYRFVLS